MLMTAQVADYDMIFTPIDRPRIELVPTHIALAKSDDFMSHYFRASWHLLRKPCRHVIFRCYYQVFGMGPQCYHFARFDVTTRYASADTTIFAMTFSGADAHGYFR